MRQYRYSRTPWRSCRDVRGARALSTAHVCDLPEAFILHREIVLAMKANVTLRAYLDLRHEYCAMKNKYYGGEMKVNNRHKQT